MLKLRHYVNLPSHSQGGFDHGDVHKSSGRVFVAHTANGTVDVIDNARHIMSIAGCPEASGVLCAQQEGVVFAAARATGEILTINATSLAIERHFIVGSKPNGLAWDAHRKHLLVADVEDFNARLVDPRTGHILSALKLPGRPRWCAYDVVNDRFLVNIKDPACVSVLRPNPLEQLALLRISAEGPHGLDLDEVGRAFVASDGKAVSVIALKTGRELKTIPIAGPPDVIWYNPQRQRLYCAIGNPGVIDVVDAEELVINEEIKTEQGAHSLTFDRNRQRLYVFLPESCRAAVYNEV